MDKLGLLLLILLIVLILICVFWRRDSSPVKSEHMAPLDWGTFPNNYPRGECCTGSLEEKACEVGNCPLGTTVTHKEYCEITHAQDSDPVARIRNIDRCVCEMSDGSCD